MDKNYKDKIKKLESIKGFPWKKALQEIYSKAPIWYVGKDKIVTLDEDAHPLAIRLKIKNRELPYIIGFLEEQGLIEEAKHSVELTMLKLTPKGFDVALSLEKHRDSTILNVMIGVFTGMMVFTGATELIVNIADSTKPNIYATLVTYTIMFIIIAISSILFLRHISNK